MSLKVFKDLIDEATVATIPESGSFKAAGAGFLSKRDPFSYAADRLIVADGCAFDVFDGAVWRQAVNRGVIDVAPVSILDAGGSLAVGTDYYVYICITGTGDAELVISANATYPAGFTAQNSRKIGGFHYGHVRHVADDGSWTPIDTNGVKFGGSGTDWKNNVSIGIVPNSVWDLKNRPVCDPEGMVKINSYSWRDIYKASAAVPIELEGPGLHVKTGKLQSKYGQIPVTGTEGANWYVFAELAALSGKRLPTYAEFIAAARGNPQGEDGADNYGWTKTTNSSRVRTGCQVNTSTGAFDGATGVKPYAISAMNCVDAIGNVQEWLDELSYREDGAAPGWAWRDVLGSGKGQAYLYNTVGLVVLTAGGDWHNGVYAGARTVIASYFPWNVFTPIGVRLACDAA
ncbi:MAG: SUMF1/EgtB/PvdO family nonheme iron enzyme [Spirochaetaceae bacterium]|jgi:formylglycine-generating enzyme required for sulfatase activity|nr:SUMF1/EgtB/PvdO family nonheme iron enzyme [Spirochaetaceae bacterium]